MTVQILFAVSFSLCTGDSDVRGLGFVRLNPVTFWRGAASDALFAEPRESPRHEVRITRPFEISTHEVTVGQFARFVEETCYLTDSLRDGHGCYGYDAESGGLKVGKGFSWLSPGFDQRPDHPVTGVSWRDANAFCTWLNQQSGIEHRLPTEAEWEYACGAGAQTRFPSGDNPASLEDEANLADQFAPLKQQGNAVWSDGQPFTAPVGTFAPNSFGLYDMQGNVSEWCYDLSSAYPAATGLLIDPVGPEYSLHRVHRGASWADSPDKATITRRGRAKPLFRSCVLGFRVVRTGRKIEPTLYPPWAPKLVPSVRLRQRNGQASIDRPADYFRPVITTQRAFELRRLGYRRSPFHRFWTVPPPTQRPLGSLPLRVRTRASSQ